MCCKELKLINIVLDVQAVPARAVRGRAVVLPVRAAPHRAAVDPAALPGKFDIIMLHTNQATLKYTEQCSAPTDLVRLAPRGRRRFHGVGDHPAFLTVAALLGNLNLSKPLDFDLVLPYSIFIINLIFYNLFY